MEKLKNIHPGEILLAEFILPLGISAYRTVGMNSTLQHPYFPIEPSHIG